MTTTIRTGAALDALATNGFVRLAVEHSDTAFVQLARELGDVIDDTPVRVVPGKRTYLASPGAIPLHTDYPDADLIAWRCESQDDDDGASLLLDGRDVVRALDAPTREALTRAMLPAMVRLGDEPLPTPILSGTGDLASIFYAPWLEPVGRPDAALEPLRAFRRAVEQTQPTAHRLAPGDVLLVDNHRVLHGRGRILERSARRLRRLWIRTRRPT
jgi:hypothetical protein